MSWHGHVSQAVGDKERDNSMCSRWPVAGFSGFPFGLFPPRAILGRCAPPLNLCESSEAPGGGEHQKQLSSPIRSRAGYMEVEIPFMANIPPPVPQDGSHSKPQPPEGEATGQGLPKALFGGGVEPELRHRRGSVYSSETEASFPSTWTPQSHQPPFKWLSHEI